MKDTTGCPCGKRHTIGAGVRVIDCPCGRYVWKDGQWYVRRKEGK
jgi:hypothetical protein